METKTFQTQGEFIALLTTLDVPNFAYAFHEGSQYPLTLEITRAAKRISFKEIK